MKSKVFLRRIFLASAAALYLLVPLAASASTWTLTGGPGLSVLTDRSGNDRTTFLLLNLSPSFSGPMWEIALDLDLRWDLENKTFYDEDWNRDGDWLRPLKRMGYRTSEGDWRVEIAGYSQMTLGSGQVVRGLIGGAETTYGLPGLLVNGAASNASFQLFVDRVYDPDVAGAAVTWNPGSAFSLSLEGAVDSSAPLVFSGRFDGGRPMADGEKSVRGLGGEAKYRFYDGDVLGLSLMVNAGSLNQEAKGTGGGVRMDLDFSSFYHNRLTLRAGTTRCRENYIPAYFDDLYQIERWGVSGNTLLQLNPLDAGGADRNMVSAYMEYGLGDFFHVRAEYDRFDDDSMKRAGLLLNLSEEDNRGLEVILWSKTLNKGENLFDIDSNMFARVSALYKFFPHLFIKGSYELSWDFVADKGGAVSSSNLTLSALYTISF